jgi:hypothetical protein
VRTQEREHREHPGWLARGLKRARDAGVALPARSDAYAVVEMNDAVSEPALIEKFELGADAV